MFCFVAVPFWTRNPWAAGCIVGTSLTPGTNHKTFFRMFLLLFGVHQHLHQWLAQYGYMGLFLALVAGIVGAPMPDETLLTVAGYLSAKGEFSLWLTWTVAIVGSGCGITISYLLGRIFGAFLPGKFGVYVGITPARLERTHQWFEHLGRWTLLVGYFVPGVRHLTALVAGVSKLEWPIFSVFAYSGAVLWVSTFISIGYFLGHQGNAIVRRLHGHERILIVGFVVLLVLVWAGRRIIVRWRH